MKLEQIKRSVRQDEGGLTILTSDIQPGIYRSDFKICQEASGKLESFGPKECVFARIYDAITRNDELAGYLTSLHRACTKQVRRERIFKLLASWPFSKLQANGSMENLHSRWRTCEHRAENDRKNLYLVRRKSALASYKVITGSCMAPLNVPESLNNV